MTLPKHLEDAAEQLKEAAWRIDQAREKPASADSLREWLEALTDFSFALSEIQQVNNESIHEKLHELAGRRGFKGAPAPSPPPSSIR
ncbi:MAG: hypothetical protein AB1515_02400 [Nitrospirota bacterium]